MRAHSTIEARPSPRELCLPVFTVLARLQHPPVLNAQDSPFWYLLDLTDVGEEGRPQDPKGCYVSWKGEQQDSAANLAVLAHSYADCRLWRSAWVPTTNLDGEDLITVQGSNCGEAWQTLWTGHSTKTRHKTSHRHFTGRQTKQACMYLIAPCPSSNSCLVRHTVNKIRHTGLPSDAFLTGPESELLVTCSRYNRSECTLCTCLESYVRNVSTRWRYLQTLLWKQHFNFPRSIFCLLYHSGHTIRVLILFRTTVNRVLQPNQQYPSE